MKTLVFGSLVLWSMAAFASGAKQVACQILSEADRVALPDAALVVDVSKSQDCDGATGTAAIAKTPLKLNVGFSASCTRPEISYPQHVSTVSLMGPPDSAIYANAFSTEAYPSEQSLQLMASYGGTVYNVIVHCKIVQ